MSTAGAAPAPLEPRSPAGTRRAGHLVVAASGMNAAQWRHGTTQHDNPAARGFRREHRRHRRHRGNAQQLPRVRLLGDLSAGSAGRTRRPEAGPAADPVPDGRDGPAPRPGARQVRARGRRGDGPAASARRQRDLRRAGQAGPAVRDAAAADRRARQLRLARRRRRAGRDAVHRGAAGGRGDGDDRLARRGHRRLHPQLRRHRDPAGSAPGRPAQPAGERRAGDRASGWPPTWRRTTSARSSPPPGT